LIFKRNKISYRVFWNKSYNMNEFFTINLFLPKNSKKYEDDVYLHGKKILDELKLKRGMKILDLGCGSVGKISIPGASRNLNVQGVDISDKALELLEKRAKEKNLSLQLRRIDINKKMPLKSNYYDAVVCINTAMHIRNIKNVLNEALRVRKPEGKLLLESIWNEENIFMKIFEGPQNTT